MSFFLRKLSISRWTKTLQFNITESAITQIRSDADLSEGDFAKLAELTDFEIAGEDEFFETVKGKLGSTKLNQCKKALRKYAIKPCKVEDISPDAITGDLKTSSNRLSFWICDGSDKRRDDGVLAIMTSPTNPSIDVTEIILIPEDKINGRFTIENSKGNTVIDTLKDYHRDIVLPNQHKLIELATIILEEVQNCNYYLYKEKQIKNMLEEAINVGLLDKGMLHTKLQTELK